MVVTSEPPSTILYLGMNKGDPTALLSDRSNTLRSYRKKSKDGSSTIPSIKDVLTPTKRSRVFDNNSYSIIKQTLKKSPKMSNYIKEVYDAKGFHNKMTARRVKASSVTDDLAYP